MPRNPVLNDHPVLAFLGKRGRGAIVEALQRNAARPLHIRELARLADVAPMVASRAIAELQELGAVEVARRGKLLAVRLESKSRVGRFLADLAPPDPPYP
jgi:DNA-binding transcriptional regulator YhcF (GntR family)